VGDDHRVTVGSILESWAAAGSRLRIADDDVFVVDAAATTPSDVPPMLVLHGFPTSSIDWRAALPMLRAERRVVLLDFPGYGLSSKPDRAYSLFEQADVVEGLAAGLSLATVDLVTHDMGDSVGGEILARSIDGTLGFDIRRRVLTNGSVYLDLAQLTDGQRFLAALPDEALDEDVAPDVDALERALLDTLAGPPPDPDEVRASADLVVVDGGNRLLPRLIRYIAERAEHEQRWTGAIERHPAPLHIVWGDLDPIAVWPMTDRLLERRPDATRTRLEGIGHYPMVEAPDAFASAVLSSLSDQPSGPKGEAG
jgi:pimeloyl-ACP methyl ester carboxylesterase